MVHSSHYNLQRKKKAAEGFFFFEGNSNTLSNGSFTHTKTHKAYVSKCHFFD